jgi:signal transduction histidine kinase
MTEIVFVKISRSLFERPGRKKKTIWTVQVEEKSIVLTRQYAEVLPRIKVYGSELNQVWTNLIVNAVDAMPEGGTLQVRTKKEPTDILVEIRDNGSGIPPDLKSRIFEPFLTTKPVGEGTGLGLDTVARIVRKHRGIFVFVSVRITSPSGRVESNLFGPDFATLYKLSHRYRAGDVLFAPAGTIHSAKNVGSGNGAELATYVVEKGKPLITLMK